MITIVAILQAINVLLVVQSSSGLQNQKTDSKYPDGTFNNVPIYLRKSADFHSSAHCIGETHNPDTAWMYRSCHFKNLCFDTSTKDFFLVKGPTEKDFQQRRKHYPPSFISTSTIPNDLTLALGGINPRWNGTDFNQGIHKVKWSPKIVDAPPKDYYMLPDNAVFVPFHSLAAHNVGHLLWDDLYAIYLLLSDFGFLASEKVLLRVDTLPLLYGTCEMRRKKAQRCAQNYEKFLPLMGIDPSTFSTAKHAKQSPASPTIICAKTAVAGLGMLSDHGLKDHGWNPTVDGPVQNVGRGSMLYQFRNFMLHNLGFPLIPSGNNPFRILLSAHSSGEPERDLDFQAQHQRLHSAFPSADVQIVEFAQMSLMDQISLTSQSNVFVSTCGGGAMTATFLPRGASLILLYSEQGGFDFASFNLTGGPAYLDSDLFNNAGYLQVHWIPIGTINTVHGLDSLEYLIRHEMDVAANGI
ncbi:unnamed protein product [Cylindrotheca closterium]|uniref:Uncharacterized protein n=1 Tax=Cylindrotheca closterium TaxID=2856 RepID=A0AAD2JLF4_9STRA|nr:unnamed protein product [Cylindrotheca closterium]